MMVIRLVLNRSCRHFTAKTGLLDRGIVNRGHLVPSYRTVGSEAYEGDGKTTMRSLNEEQEGQRLLIDTYSTLGFRLTNHMFVLGSIALFPRSLFQWNVRKPDHITGESLSLFLKLEPKLDVLVIGYGVPLEKNELVYKIHGLCRQHRIGLEMLPTREACATFNFLNSELRNVAAGLIPPLFVINSDENYINPARSRRFLIDNVITTDLLESGLKESSEKAKNIIDGQIVPKIPTNKNK